MLLTGKAITSLFEYYDHMELYNCYSYRVLLQSKGIETTDELGEFQGRDSWPQIVEIRKHSPKITDLENTSNIIYKEPFNILSK